MTLTLNNRPSSIVQLIAEPTDENWCDFLTRWRDQIFLWRNVVVEGVMIPLHELRVGKKSLSDHKAKQSQQQSLGYANRGIFQPTDDRDLFWGLTDWGTWCVIEISRSAEGMTFYAPLCPIEELIKRVSPRKIWEGLCSHIRRWKEEVQKQAEFAASFLAGCDADTYFLDINKIK